VSFSFTAYISEYFLVELRIGRHRRRQFVYGQRDGTVELMTHFLFFRTSLHYEKETPR
jgi:hypothetical protein